MSKLSIGDRIEIIYHSEAQHIGEKGKVMYIGGSLTSSTQPVEEKLSGFQREVRYSVKLDDGTIINNLREIQLRKS